MIPLHRINHSDSCTAHRGQRCNCDRETIFRLQASVAPQLQRPTLTPRQRDVYRFLFAYIAREDVAPTQEEIAEFFQFKSLASVAEYLGVLEKKGYIERAYNSARGVKCLVHIDELAALPPAPALEGD